MLWLEKVRISSSFNTSSNYYNELKNFDSAFTFHLSNCIFIHVHLINARGHPCVLLCI